LNKRLSYLATAPLILLIIVMMTVSVQAGVSGKISGVVETSETGAPIVGATVKVVNTNLTTKTDEDGEYFIIDVPIGKYDMVVSHVGFESLLKKEVQVLVDLTTPVDFAIAEVAIELPDEMVVYAANPLVQKDLTASRVIFTEERLKNLPNVQSIQAILTNYPGVVVDRNSAMHVRGGRSGQVSYYYDGFSVQDPFTANAGIRIMPLALEELSLTSGGFTSEYGEALSGVVSAVTREGTAKYRGKVRLYQGATHKYDVNTADWGDLSLITNRSGSFNLSGPLPGLDSQRYTFFTAGEYLRDDGYLPHNWLTSYTGTAKVSAQPIPKLKLKTNLTYHLRDGAIYNHSDANKVSYDFNLDGLPVYDRKAYLFGLAGNYVVSERAIFSLTFNQFYTRTKYTPQHLQDVHWSEWPGYSEDEDGVYNGTIDDNNYLGTSIYDNANVLHVSRFTTGGDFQPTYQYQRARYNAFVLGMLHQMNKVNQVKAGVEYRKYDVEWDFKQFYNEQPYGEYYNNAPFIASAYIEDKLEYSDFVLNLGLRLDHRDVDIAYNYTPTDTVDRYKDADTKTRISPRLGLSFPVSEKSVLHFNYGVYYQAPLYEYLYTNLDGESGSGLPLFGNPDLDPEETISYELGLDHLIGENLRLDVTAYYKDINDLVAAREDSVIAGTSTLTKFTNDDYGTVTGVDLSLEVRPGSSNLSGSVSYGYMIAKGNGSYAKEAYYTYLTSTTDTLPPITEYALDFDQRHTVTAVLDYRVPGNWKGSLFGLGLPGAWGLSLAGYFGSGLPYSKTDADGNRLGERNESRLPANYSVDMRFNKDFNMGRGSEILTFFFEVDNIFDRRNVINVYSRTGLPNDDAQIRGADLALNQEEIEHYDYLSDHDPQNYSAPRTVRTGFEFSF